jgi:hypothetical protein
MPSVSEEVARIHWLIKQGKITGEDRCRLVVPRLETGDRIKKAKAEGRTRLIKQLDTPETYMAFEREFARYKENAGNVQVAFSLMLEVLTALPSESIKRMSKDEPEHSESLGDA